MSFYLKSDVFPSCSIELFLKKMLPRLVQYASIWSHWLQLLEIVICNLQIFQFIIRKSSESCHPTFTDKKVLRPHGHKKMKSFAQVSLTK